MTYSQNKKCPLKFLKIFDFKISFYHNYSTNICFIFHFIIYLSCCLKFRRCLTSYLLIFLTEALGGLYRELLTFRSSSSYLDGIEWVGSVASLDSVYIYIYIYKYILLTLRLLMSYIYIYMEHLFLMFLDHTQRRSTVGRTPLDE